MNEIDIEKAGGATRAQVVRATVGLRAQREAVRLDVLPFWVDGRWGFNGKGYAQCATYTHGNVLYAVAYRTDGHPIIGRRTLPHGDWETFDLYTVSGNPLLVPVGADSHLVVVIFIDVLGYIHVCANMHGSSLRYIRSVNPHSITSWEAPGMTGVAENQVAYPRFNQFSDGTIIFHYRNGVSGEGDTYLKVYNPNTKIWVDRGKIVDGLASSESFYENHVFIEPTWGAHPDRLWESGSWRTEGGDTNTTKDISAMYSDDKGVTWKALNGATVPLPLLHSNADALVLDTPDTNSGISNQYGFTVDLDGRPHWATHLADGSAPDRNIHHLWWDGEELQDEQVTNWHNTMGLVTRATRPDILCTRQGRLLITYTTRHWGKTGNSFRVLDVTNPGYSVDFSVCDIPGIDCDFTYEDTALREQNLLRCLITTCTLELASPSPAMVNESCLRSQWGGVLTVDCDQIDRVAAGVADIPRIESVITSSNVSGASPAAELAAQASNSALSGAPIINLPATLRDKMAFARVTARGQPSTSGQSIFLVLQVGEVDGSGVAASSQDFMEVEYNVQSSAMEKASPWVPIPLGPINGRGARLVERYRTTGGSLGRITSCTVEVGVLAGCIFLPPGGIMLP